MSLFAALALMQSSESVQPGPIMSAMIGRYHGAQSLVAEIETTSLADRERVTVESKIVYQKESKVYFKQTASGAGQRKVYTIISDGNKFAYPPPIDRLSRDRNEIIVEPTYFTGAGNTIKQMAVSDIYKVVTLSIPDRSVASDILFSNIEDLKAIRLQWATMKHGGLVPHRRTINGVPETIMAHRIFGDWKPNGDASQVMGAYEFLVSETYDLLSYRQIENFSLQGRPVKLDQTWNVNARVNAAVDEKLFIIPRAKPKGQGGGGGKLLTSQKKGLSSTKCTLYGTIELK